MTVQYFQFPSSLSDEQIKHIFHQQSQFYFISSSLKGKYIEEYSRIADDKYSSFLSCSALILDTLLIISPDLIGELSIQIYFNEEHLTEPLIDFRFTPNRFYEAKNNISLTSPNTIFEEKIEEIQQQQLFYSYDLISLFHQWDNDINTTLTSNFPQFSRVYLVKQATKYFEKEGFLKADCEWMKPILHQKQLYRLQHELEQDLPQHSSGLMSKI